MLIYVIAGIVTFLFTTVLTIAGVVAAFILIPVFIALGIPLLEAMSTALLLNSIAMVFASVSYAREKLIVFRTAFPILIVATALSPLGARMAEHLPRNVLLWLFVGFLVFAGSMMSFYKAEEKEIETDAKRLAAYGIGVGSVAGYLGGLLGVGGGEFHCSRPGLAGIQSKESVGYYVICRYFFFTVRFFGPCGTRKHEIAVFSHMRVRSCIGRSFGSRTA